MKAKRSRPFKVSKALYPFKDHWFERDGVAMHYVDEGPKNASTPPVVLLHGNPTWSFLYRDIIKRLAKTHRCLAPDYPGFGFSDHPKGYGYTPQEHAEWVAAWLEELQVKDFILVVQDWGGPIGLKVATDNPDAVAGLVILNTWAWPPNLFMRTFSYVVGGPLGKYLHLQRNFFADKIVKSGMYRKHEKSEEVFRAYTDPFPTPAKRMGTYVFPRAIRQCDKWLKGIEDNLFTLVGKPKEMVWAMQDMAFGRESIIDRFGSHFPGTPLIRLEKASHYLQEDDPEAIADSIERVSKQLTSPH